MAVSLLVFAALPGTARSDVSLQQMVDDSRTTLANFIADPDMAWFRNNIGEARAVLIVPSLVRAGFIVGGSGGGVLIAQDSATG